MNTQKLEYPSLAFCLLYFFLAIVGALQSLVFLSVVCATFGMVFLVLFLDVWLEPEKWKQKQ